MKIKQLPTGAATTQIGNRIVVMTRQELEKHLTDTNQGNWINNLKKTIQLCTK